MWNTYRTTPDFRDGKPYLLRFFDEVRFYPVAADELLRLREAFPYGRFQVRTEKSSFRYSAYRAWLAENAASIADFKKQQQGAFEAERERWRAAGQDVVASAAPAIAEDAERPQTPPGCSALASPIAGSVWKVAADAGARVEAGDPVVIVEAMKTEIAVSSGVSGTVRRVLVSPGATVMPGQVVAFIEGV
jgi:urea carboxylase